MKKIRSETTEYWHDAETGKVTVKVIEEYLVSEEDGEERWQTTHRSIPVV